MLHFFYHMAASLGDEDEREEKYQRRIILLYLYKLTIVL